MLPCPFQDIDALVQVVFLAPVKSLEELEAVARQSTVLHVRGQLVCQWARFLAQHWGTVQLASDAVLAEYSALEDGVPPNLLKTAIYTDKEQDSADMLSALAHRNAGYTNGRQSAETVASIKQQGQLPSAPPLIEEDGETEEREWSVGLEGVTALEMETLEALPPDISAVLADKAAKLIGSDARQVQRRVLASAAGSVPGLLSDYDGMWLPMTHPWLFPYAKGGRPVGMSMVRYIGLLLRRWPRQMSEDPTLALDANDLVQRHSVHLHASLQTRSHSAQAQSIAAMAPGEVQSALEHIVKGSSGPGASERWKELSPAARNLCKAYKCAGSTIRGSDPSFAKLRSAGIGIWHGLGEYTISINLNPSATHASLALELAGHKYTFDEQGYPEGRPATFAAMQILAQNPVACAKFFHAFLCAFCEVFLGWPPGAAQQENPDCLFGVVYAYIFKHETTGRASNLHSHCAAILPMHQHAQLLRYQATEEGRVEILRRLDGIICQSLHGHHK
jgi:hypothetical protein